MTDSELKQYRFIKLEIEDMDFRIKELTSRLKSRAHIRNLSVNYKLQAEELIRKRNVRLTELIKREAEMYDYICSIRDPEIRMIFILRYIDGKTQEEIGAKLFIDRSGVSKRITKHFEMMRSRELMPIEHD